MFEVVEVQRPEAGAYALKRVRNPRRRQRFEAEVAAVARLRHPNVIRLVDRSALDAADGDDARQFMAMPLAAGGALASRVKVYKGSLDGALAVARPLASALSAAHSAGIVHRDVKPGIHQRLDDRPVGRLDRDRDLVRLPGLGAKPIHHGADPVASWANTRWIGSPVPVRQTWCSVLSSATFPRAPHAEPWAAPPS